MKRKLRVLMLGPGRHVRGGISSVVNGWYEAGLGERAELRYIPTMVDGCRAVKLFAAALAFVRFLLCVRRFDIVHVHMAAQASFWRKRLFVKAAKKRGVKVVIHQHSADFDQFYLQEVDEKRQKEIKYIFEIADAVLALSERWASFYKTLVSRPEKVLVLPNAVRCPKENKTDYGDRNVLFLGRLGARKGVYDLLRAIPAVLETVPDARFILCGDGELERCKRESKRLGVLNAVTFPGWIGPEEKERLFSECGVFVLPSYREGVPMALLEAMGHGLASVSTEAGGPVPEHDVNGVKIPAGDVNALAQAITGLLLDPEEKACLGQAGRKVIQDRFGMEETLERLTGFYYKLCLNSKECTK